MRMRQEWRERFHRHRVQRKQLGIDPGMHHGTCVSHVPWCMSGSLTRVCGENDTDIPNARTTRYFTYLARGPLKWIYYSQICDNFHWITCIIKKMTVATSEVLRYDLALLGVIAMFPHIRQTHSDDTIAATKRHMRAALLMFKHIRTLQCGKYGAYY